MITNKINRQKPWPSPPHEIPTRDIILALCKYLKVNICLKPDSEKVEIRPREEDEPIKKPVESCLSCRFYKETTGNWTFSCLNEMVNRCFVHSIYMYIESTKQIEFSCKFYEYNLSGLNETQTQP